MLASAELEAGDDSKRPTVQIGDPFEESKLLECCLELLEKDLLVSLQDLGAAGLTSSAGEMASKGGVGIDIDVGRVPLREPDLEPFEVMVSESQERMLAVVEPRRLDEVIALCERWQTGAAAIGEVTDSGPPAGAGRRRGGRRRAGLGAGRRVPALRPRARGAAGLDLRQRGDARRAVALSAGRSADPEDPSAILLALLGSPNIASKRWAFEQYDSVVGSRTVRRPEAADAAVLMIPESDRAIAIAIDGNGRRVACDPHAGAIEAVLECAQNLACVGAEPLGPDQLPQLRQPREAGVAWQLDRAVTGLAEACKALGVPVVGGNVSLYNETEHGPIYPTPVVGMVGELPDPGRAPGLALSEGDELVLVGPFAPSLAGSELVKLRGELDAGLPATEIEPVAAALALRARGRPRRRRLRRPRRQRRRPRAARSAEMAIAGGIGAEIDLDPFVELRGCSGETALFGEGPGGVAARGPRVERARPSPARARDAGVDAVALGTAAGDRIEISAAEREVSVALADAAAAWRSLGAAMERLAEAYRGLTRGVDHRLVPCEEDSDGKPGVRATRGRRPDAGR